MTKNKLIFFKAAIFLNIVAFFLFSLVSALPQYNNVDSVNKIYNTYNQNISNNYYNGSDLTNACMVNQSNTFIAFPQRFTPTDTNNTLEIMGNGQNVSIMKYGSGTDVPYKGCMIWEPTNTFGRGSLHIGGDVTADNSNCTIEDTKVHIVHRAGGPGVCIGSYDLCKVIPVNFYIQGNWRANGTQMSVRWTATTSYVEFIMESLAYGSLYAYGTGFNSSTYDVKGDDWYIQSRASTVPILKFENSTKTWDFTGRNRYNYSVWIAHLNITQNITLQTGTPLQAVCYRADKTLGACTDAVNATGGCTCT